MTPYEIIKEQMDMLYKAGYEAGKSNQELIDEKIQLEVEQDHDNSEIREETT